MAFVAILATAVSCTEPGVGSPATIRRVTPATITAVAGSTVVGGVTVRVLDGNGKGVKGSSVAFTILSGDGTVTPSVVNSDADGQAHADWIIGQTAGQNTLLASNPFMDSTVVFTATGAVGAATAVAISPHTLRFPVGTTTASVFGSTVDQYGNSTGTATTYTSRNTGLVTISAAGVVTVVGGASGTTYIVASGSTFLDSSLVIVLKSGDTPCTGIGTKVSLNAGDVVTTGFSDNGVCINPVVAGAEYAWVPYFNSSVTNAQTAVTLSVFGNKAPNPLGSANPGVTPSLAVAAQLAAQIPVNLIDGRLRDRERVEMPAAVAYARQWYEDTHMGGALRAAVVPKIGDQMQINTSLEEFCLNPTYRTGRVVAVTTHAVVMADIANPAGFTDAEYTSFGFNFDTLAYPTDVANFGAPTDIDNNGSRTIIFFTHAVNEASLGTLGFFYGRDLLPKSGPLGSCVGSNVAELINLFVPDGQYSKSYVAGNTVSTMAHEFQHLINQSRRLYVNTTAAPTEERWLNEGLSHEAEELMFYRVSGLQPRQNIGTQLFSSPYSQAYVNYALNNLNRLREYLLSPASQSPVGIDDSDDDFATRGAVWSYLRYAADQRSGATESSFWNQLVNSNLTGLNNLYQVVGADARLVMRDWTLGILLDDLVPGVNPKYQQQSWNFRIALGGYPLSAPSLPITGAATQFTMSAGGTVFARFGVAANQEAYVSAAGLGTNALPKNVLMALVRTK